ncbi:hypothetical protein MNBD_GAMMA21-30 [hydrothermal vent metagenome]|uniref:ATP synthase F1 complex delta/epsilon subunit N-terminal domain-containing protein n=1 Tax=hydrothermal vent metagenome TaxID=652676 RepID=A0A3B0ZXE3_9ZZZZ
MGLRFHIDIVSSESLIYSGQSDQAFVPTRMGELGIYARHAPLIAHLKPGILRIMLDNKEKNVIFVSSGFVEIQVHVVTILADTIIRSDEFDAAEAQAARYLKKHEGEIKKRSIDAELEVQIAIYRTLEEVRKTKDRQQSWSEDD